MNRTWFWTAGILTGLCLAAMPALPQAYTISAKPGVVNYIEGNISLNGQPVSPGELQSAALNAGDVLSVTTGKAEVLLTPGVFLRLGNNTQVRMISPSLVDTQLELVAGEAMIEVDQIVKDCRVSVLNHGASILIEKEGLYRLNADDAPRVAVIDGKAQIYLGDKKLDLGKGHEVVLSEMLKPEKFDRKKEDDLYAWSNIRSEYNASVSYQAARSAPANGFSAYPSGLGYGYGGGGWLWNAGLSSWAWLPGDGAFFSPFGWGFFSPGAVGYAPVIAVPVGPGGRWQGRGSHDQNGDRAHGGDRHHNYPGGPAGGRALVPVNPNRPPAMGATSSPWADHAARREAARQAWAAGGFRSQAGSASPGFDASHGGGGGHPGWSGSHPSGSRPAGSPAGGGGWHGGGAAAGSGGGGYHGGGGGGGYHGGGGGGGNSGGGARSASGGAGGTHGR